MRNRKETLRRGGMCVTVTRMAAHVLPQSTLSTTSPASSRLLLIKTSLCPKRADYSFNHIDRSVPLWVSCG
jgi:hypothetical protein